MSWCFKLEPFACFEFQLPVLQTGKILRCIESSDANALHLQKGISYVSSHFLSKMSVCPCGSY